jgi:hypothetical protein
VAVEANGNILVLGLIAGTGFDGALFRINPTTGFCVLLSDFGDPTLGPLSSSTAGMTVRR